METVKRICLLFVIIILCSCTMKSDHEGNDVCNNFQQGLGYEYRYETINHMPLIDVEIPQEWIPQLVETIPEIQNMTIN